MKKATGLLTLILFAAIAVASFYTVNRTPQRHRVGYVAEKTTRGSEDDPQARLNYEWRRLRNPQSNRIPRNIRQKELQFARTLPTREAVAIAKGQGNALAESSVLTWNARGPFNVGGRTRALAFDVSNENIILAGGVSGGLYRSTDGGATWTNTSGASQLHSITAIAQDTRAGKTNIWYCTSGEFRGGSAGGGGASFRGDGIFKSVDGGMTWTQLPATISDTPESFDQPFDFCWNIAVDPSNTSQDEVYAATFGGLQRSLDGGTTWATVKGGFSNSVSQYTDVVVTSTGVVYAAFSQSTNNGTDSPDRGIWRSTDGATWTEITPAGWPLVYNRVVLAVAPSDESRLYFFADTPISGLNGVSFWHYTYLSGDGSGAGGSWSNRSANLPALGDPVGNLDPQGSYDMIVCVKPDNPDVVFVGGTNLYRSTDGFATSTNWTWIGGYNTTNDISIYPNHHPDLHAQAFLPSNPNVVISGHDGGLSKTTNVMADSVIWSSLNSGYVTGQFYSVAIDHATAGNDIITGGLQDNGTYFTNNANASTPWLQIGSGDGGYTAIADGRSAFFSSVQNGKTFREIRNDAGQLSIWQRVDPAGGSGYLFINPYVLDPNDNDILYMAGGDRLWRNNAVSTIPPFSNDPATVGWTQLTNTAVGSGTISALAVSGSPANILYYGTTNGQVFRLDNADSGNPVPVNIGSGKGLPANAYVSSIAVDPIDGNRVLLVFSNYGIQSLFFTQNGGDSWTDVSGNLEENSDGSGSGPSARWAEIVPANSATYYFVATSAGLFSTTSLNGGSTIWAQEGASTIGNVVVDMIDARLADGLVVAATHGAGVFSANIPESEFLFPASNLTAQANGNDVLLQWTSPQGGGGQSGEVELVFDDGSFESFLGFTTGTGELVGGPFAPPSYPATLTSMSFLTAGSQTGDNVAIKIYLDPSGNATNPTGLQLAGTVSSVQIGPGGLFQTVDLSALNITLNSSATFFVSVEQLVPDQNVAVGLDTDAPNGNAFFGGNGSFSPISDAGFNGAYGIRAVVDISGSNAPAGEAAGTELTALSSRLSQGPGRLAAARGKRMVAPLSRTHKVNARQALAFNPQATLQSFNVYRSTSPGARATGTLISTVDAAVTSFDDLDLPDGTYYFQVTGVYDTGESIPSNEVSAVISVVSVADDEPQLPEAFSLQQNFPNPFNPTTVIQFALPQSALGQAVKLEIFNTLGQKVRTLVNAPQSPGVHVVEWDGHDAAGKQVASGMYLYRLRAGDFVAQRKMILMR